VSVGPRAIEGGNGEDFGTERASASLVGPVVARAPRRVRAARSDTPLDVVQRWFLDAVTHPRGIEAGLRTAGRRHGVSDIATAGPTLDAVGRMEIYHYAYHARLHECLADDFPAVAWTLGEHGFARLCDRVIVRHPSRSPNLNIYGRALVDTLPTGGRVPHRAFLADLARLEWALTEAVHAATPESLDPAALAATAPERWADARFTASPGLRVLGFDFPVNAYLQAFREDQGPRVPRRRTTATAVYRRGFVVWRMDLTPTMKDLLDRLLAGVPLGEALAPLDGNAEADRVMEWFTAWVSGGFFAAVDFGE
jgi:hypothetical protein